MAPSKSKESEPLPKISFRKVEDGDNPRLNGVHESAARSYGYNAFKPFERPDHYIRHVEPLETELATQVEYDMDEQDQEWLDAVNRDRKKDRIDQISYEIFEVIMDRLEKEWFELMKLMPKPEMALPSEDTSCAICDDGEAENSNAILFCDGCNLAVHQDCYGVPYIPEGQWLCRKCTVSPENPVSCVLCPNEGGAFKQTNKGQWAHLLCSIWIPEVTVANTHIMEPIEGVEHIPKSRWKLICSLCKERVGACIQCDVKTCFTAFHVTCARRHKLLMAMKNLAGQEEPQLRAFCERHLPKHLKELRDAGTPPPPVPADPPSRGEEEEPTVTELPAPQSPTHDTSSANKAARAYSSKFSPTGPPLVPQIILDHIGQYIHKSKFVKKPLFVAAVARYWSLKRESRRGAPLLKRLHLEPWTASAMNKQQSDEEKAKKLENIIRLRKELEKVRMLAELTRKREKEKLRSVQILQSFIEDFFFPFQGALREAFSEIASQDRNNVFRSPVSEATAPDYYSVVKQPMTWNQINEKLEGHDYFDISSFEADVKLVLENALLYNKPGSSLYKTASKLLGIAQSVIEKLKQTVSRVSAARDSMFHAAAEKEDSPHIKQDSPVDGGLGLLNTAPPVGDLEQMFAVLEMLSQPMTLTDEVDYVAPVDIEPLESLLAFEFTRLKSRPPSPSPPPTASVVPESDQPLDSAPPLSLTFTVITQESVAAASQADSLTPVKPKAKRGRKPKIRPSEPIAAPAPSTTSVIAPLTTGPTSEPEVGSTAPPMEDVVPDVIEPELVKDEVEPAVRSTPEVEIEPVEPSITEASVVQEALAEDDPQAAGPATVEALIVAEPEEQAPKEKTPSDVQPRSTRASKKRKRSPEPAETTASEEAESHRSSSPPPKDSEETEGPSRKRKRVSSVEAPHTPPLVQDVGSHDSFLMFNQGWVLPEGSRRRTKQLVPIVTSNRKSHKPSKLSVAATSPAENETLRTEPTPAPSEPPVTEPEQDGMAEAETLSEPAPLAVPDVEIEAEAPVEGELTEPEPEVDPEPVSMPQYLPEAAVGSSKTDEEHEPTPEAEQVASDEVTEPTTAVVEPKAEQDVEDPPQEAPILHYEIEELDPPVVTEARPESESVVEQDATPPVETEVEPEPVPTLDDTKDDEPDMEVEPPEQPQPAPSAVDSESQQAAAVAAEEAEVEDQVQGGEMDLEPEASPSNNAGGSLEDDSDLSDLSSLPDNDGPGSPSRKSRSPRKSLVEDRQQPDVPAVADEEQQEQPATDASTGEEDNDESRNTGGVTVPLEGGTLVWAKTGPFPFFPAVVYEEDDDDIPYKVLDGKEHYETAAKEKGEGPVSLVRFYDNTNSWGWIPSSKIKMLGEDADVDHFMLNQQRFKTANLKTLCRKSYNEALAEMESAPEDGPNEKEGSPSSRTSVK